MTKNEKSARLYIEREIVSFHVQTANNKRSMLSIVE